MELREGQEESGRRHFLSSPEEVGSLFIFIPELFVGGICLLRSEKEVLGHPFPEIKS